VNLIHGVYNFKIENPVITLEHGRYSPEAKVFFAISKKNFLDLAFFLFFGKRSRYKPLLYDFCLSWKRILMTLSLKKFRCHLTSTWLSGTTSTLTFPGDETTKQEQVT